MPLSHPMPFTPSLGLLSDDPLPIGLIVKASKESEAADRLRAAARGHLWVKRPSDGRILDPIVLFSKSGGMTKELLPLYTEQVAATAFVGHDLANLPTELTNEEGKARSLLHMDGCAVHMDSELFTKHIISPVRTYLRSPGNPHPTIFISHQVHLSSHHVRPPNECRRTTCILHARRRTQLSSISRKM